MDAINDHLSMCKLYSCDFYFSRRKLVNTQYFKLNFGSNSFFSIHTVYVCLHISQPFNFGHPTCNLKISTLPFGFFIFFIHDIVIGVLVQSMHFFSGNIIISFLLYLQQKRFIYNNYVHSILNTLFVCFFF